MQGRMAAAAGLVLLLVACASAEPAPQRGAEAAPLPPPPRAEQALPAPAMEAPPVAAPNVAAPPPSSQQARHSGEDEIVVPGQTAPQAVPFRGDPRSIAQRNEDIRAWDQCVSRAQAAFDTDPMRPQMDSPEELCARSLGMTDRGALPDARR